MRPSRSFFLAAACAALCSVAAPAWSQPSPKDKIEAITLTSTGRTALKEGRFEDAITALRRANELDPTSAPIRVELARAQAGAGRLVDASTTLHGIDLTTATTPLEKQATEDSKKLLAEIEARIPWLLVTIQGPKEGKASVSIDGKEVDVTAEVPLDPGEHTVQVEAEGWLPGEQKVKLAEGVHEEVKLQLERDAPEPPPPPPVKPLPPPPPPSTGLLKSVPMPAMIAFGVGGVGLAVGSVFGILAFTSTSEAEDRCERTKCPRSARRDIDAALLNGNISTGAFIVGGVGVATGVVLMLTMPKSSAPAPAQTGRAHRTPAKGAEAWVRPWVGPGQAGVVGTF